MKTAPPTAYQACLLSRALEAQRYTKQHRALWRAVYKQAEATVRHYRLRWDAQQLVEYWLSIQPDSTPSASNSIELDDMQCGFQTIAQESGMVCIPIESWEEHGDTWQEAPEDHQLDRLQSALDWRNDLHPVTQRDHLPRWCDGTSGPDPEAHLEPLVGFEPLTCYLPKR